jgi:hypothetical protein
MPQYQGVWTLEQQAQAQSNQQWVTDPNFKNTILLLQADGTGSGSQNQTFLDSSTNNFFITRGGNATQGSFSPFSQAPGYWSNFFDGSSAKLTLPSNAVFSFGTGAYTVEFFVYFFSIAGTDSRIFDAGSASGSFGVSIDNTNAVNIAKYGTGYVVQTPARALPSNQWTHVAVVRDSTSTNATRIYINGSLVVTGTDNNNWTVTTTPSICGLDLSLYNPQCYLSNLRVVKGGALYTSNFTPTTAPLSTTVSSGTVSLLTCQSSRFVDNSVNAFTITTVSTPSVQAFGPFAPPLQWTPDVVGGSGYFDGSGDYLTTPDNANLALGTGAFTVECWFYGVNNTDGILSSVNSGSGSYGLGFYFASTTSLKVGIQSNSVEAIGYSTTVAKNTWYHVVAVRNASTNYSVYVNGTRIGTTTNSTNISLQTWGVGSTYSNPGSNYNGYITGIRIVKGSAVYDPTQSTLTVPTTPPTAVTNTQLLLNMTNAGIYDGKMASVLETVASAQVATSPVKYGSGSMYFSGVSPYSYLKGNANLSQAVALAGDFTVECWVWLTTNTSDSTIIDTRPGSNAGNYFLFYLWTSGGSTKPVVAWYTPAVGYIVNSGGTVPANAWTHIAVTRANGMMRSFINGVVQQTATNTTAYANPGAPYPYIGASYSVTTDSFKGYIDDLRITNGVARYVANFTPPQQALPRQ